MNTIYKGIEEKLFYEIVDYVEEAFSVEKITEFYTCFGIDFDEDKNDNQDDSNSDDDWEEDNEDEWEEDDDWEEDDGEISGKE